jgi:hypothetical protein
MTRASCGLDLSRDFHGVVEARGHRADADEVWSEAEDVIEPIRGQNL